MDEEKLYAFLEKYTKPKIDMNEPNIWRKKLSEIFNIEKCECCGSTPVVGTRYSKGIDNGATLKVCEECKKTQDWDVCIDCLRDIDECECE